MGWFDEQIRERIRQDDEAFQGAMAGMADVVMGEKLARALADERVQTSDAIGEILKYYHVKARELPDTIRDLNGQLDDLLRPSGMMRRTVKLEGAWYRDAIGAMIGVRRDDGSTVALIPGGLKGYTFFDHTNGRRVPVTGESAKLLETEALCFYRPLPQKKIGLRDLAVYMIHALSTRELALLALGTLAVTLVGMLLPYITRLIYGPVIDSGRMQLFFAVFGVLICATLSKTLLETVRKLLMSCLSTRVSIQVEAASMMRLLSLPASFFRQYASGDLSERLGHMGNICRMLGESILSTGLTSAFSLVYLLPMFRYAPGVAAPAIVIILVTVAISLSTTLLQMRLSRRQMELSARESGVDYALIAGVQKIKLAGAERRAFARWASAYSESARLSYDPPALLKFSSVIATGVSLIGTIVIYYYTIKTRVPLSDYFAFSAAYGSVMGAFMALIGMAASFAQIRPMLHMVQPILQTVPEVDARRKTVTRLSGGIELNNVSFRYVDSMPPVIDDLSMKIRPGEYVAIVGRTGCGKSTLMRLLLGFETAQKGAIYYDGQDMQVLDLKSLRRSIGAVMQDGKLFQGDIFSNITISAPWLTMNDAWEAAEIAGIAEDIRRMPMGMHTLISEGSGGISGGQRQRLLIARAVAAKPRILLFDEATSALDNLTQKQVSDALDSLRCTRIVIAHRLSTIRHCDRILVLDGGKIVEEGSYDELIAAGGMFAALVERQRLDTASLSEE